MKRRLMKPRVAAAATLSLVGFVGFPPGCGSLDVQDFLADNACDIFNCQTLPFINDVFAPPHDDADNDHDDMDMDDDHEDAVDGHDDGNGDHDEMGMDMGMDMDDDHEDLDDDHDQEEPANEHEEHDDAAEEDEPTEHDAHDAEEMNG